MTQSCFQTLASLLSMALFETKGQNSHSNTRWIDHRKQNYLTTHTGLSLWNVFNNNLPFQDLSLFRLKKCFASGSNNWPPKYLTNTTSISEHCHLGLMKIQSFLRELWTKLKRELEVPWLYISLFFNQLSGTQNNIDK